MSRKYIFRSLPLTLLEITVLVTLLQSLTNGTPINGIVDYSGHVVLRLHPQTPGDFHLIWNLSQRDYLDLEIWGEPMLNHTLDVRVAPQAYSYITKCLDYYRIKWKVEISDIQSLIDAESQPQHKRSRTKRALASIPPKLKYKKRRKFKGKKYWNKLRRRHRRNLAKLRKGRALNQSQRYTIVGQYARYRQIRQWMKYLEAIYPELVKIIHIGRTYENRVLEIIKIGSNKHNANGNKSAIWLDGGIHSREWISPATVVYIAEKLVTDYGKDQDITNLVNNFDWYLLPVANPDGYEYSHTVDRLWRKTRSRPTVKGYERCLGVDMNRNFEFQWKGHCEEHLLCGSSNPCQSTYAGEHPFSEPEVMAMAQTLYAHRSNIKLYLSLHSYSQLWLTPWGYTGNPPKDKLVLMNVAKKGMDALRKTHGTHYIAGSPANILYAAGGGSYDWAKAVAGIKYSYTIELRDKGRYGFLLPQQYIHPVGEETWNGIKVVALELNN